MERSADRRSDARRARTGRPRRVVRGSCRKARGGEGRGGGDGGDGGDDDGDEAGALRYGAHTDYQTFTVLRADPEVGGLQVQLADGRWLDAPREADAPARGDDEPLLFVNAGDLTARWTNGRWRSAPHRVVNTEIARARRSLVFFTGPDDDAEISPIVAEGDTARFAPITAGAHLRAKLGISNV